MRNRLPILVLLLFFWQISLQGQVTVSIGHKIAFPGETVQVPVTVNFSQVAGGVGAFDFYIEYDMAVLTFIGLTNEVLQGIMYSIPNPVLYPNRILIIWNYETANSVPSFLNGKLLDLVFAFTGGDSDLEMVLEGTSFVSDQNADPVSGTFSNGSVTEAVPYEVTLSTDPADNGATLLGAGIYKWGDTITISTTDDVEGYVFSHWDGAPEFVALLDNPLALSTFFTMPESDVHFTAIYEAIDYSITIMVQPVPIFGDPNPQGAGTEYHFQDDITISVDALEGYNFIGWEAATPEDLALLTDPTALSNSFSMPSRNLVFTAIYEAIPFTLTLRVDPVEITGQASPQGAGTSYTIGDVINISVSEVTAYTFVGWEGEAGDMVLITQPTSLSTVFTMPPRNVTLTAKYVLTDYTVTILTDPSSIATAANPTGAGDTYNMSDLVNIAVQPVPGYTFVGWFPDNVSDVVLFNPSGEFANSFIMPNRDVVLTARYILTDFSVNLLVDPDYLTGQAQASGAGTTYHMGDLVTLGIQDIPGFYFMGWTSQSGHIGLLSNPAVYNPTFIMPDADVVFTANYTRGSFTVVLIVNPSELAPLVMFHGGLQGNGTYFFEAPVTITAPEIPGYQFVHWTDTWNMGIIGLLDDPNSLSNSFDMPASHVYLSAVYAPLITLTVNVEGNGSVLVNGNPYTAPVQFPEGAVVNLEAVPNSGWQFDSWDNTSSDNLALTTVLMDASKTVTATFIKKQYTLTVNLQGNGMVQVDGTPYTIPVVVEEGEVLSLQAMAGEGWLFDNWSGAVTDTDPAASLLMDDNKTVTATFTRKEYTLTVITNPGGAVTVNGLPYTAQLTFLHGDTPSLRALPNAGWSFSGWSGDLSGTLNPQQLLMNGNKTVVATFSEIPLGKVILTVYVEGSGQITVDGVPYTGSVIVDEGSTLSVEAIPDEGWLFAGWSGDLPGQSNPETIFMDVSREVTAVFVRIQYTLTINVTGNGTVLVNNIPYTSPVTLFHGDTPSIEAVAAIGSQFTGWSGSLSGTQNPASVVMDGNKEITAAFEIAQYTLTINITGNGTVLVDGIPYSGPLLYQYGATPLIEALPGGGSQFVGWSSGFTGTDPVTSILIDANKTITASFSEIPPTYHTLTIIYRGNGSVDVDGIPYTVPVLAEEGTILNLQALADEGWQFDRWTTAIDGTNPTTGILMDANKIVIAIFIEAPPEVYTLTILTAGSGHVEVNGLDYTAPISATEGSILNLQALPAAGWQFSGWSGDLNGSDPAASIYMDGNKTITATFSELPPPQYTLTVIVEGDGQVLIDGVVWSGVPMVFDANTPPLYVAAIAAAGWQFDIWDGHLQGTVPFRYLVMNEDKIIRATFSRKSFTLTVDIIGSGTVLVDGVVYSGPVTYLYEDAPVLNAFPGSLWQFDGWSGDLGGTASPQALLIDGNKHVTATFSEIPPVIYTLTLSTSGNGQVMVDGVPYTSGVFTAEVGTVFSLEAVAAAGVQFDGWSGDLTGTTPSHNITLDSDKQVHATFSDIPPVEYILTVAVTGSGSVDVNGTTYTGPLTFQEGSTVSLRAVPAEGWQFDGWSGDLTGPINPQALIMDGNKMVTAVFSQLPPPEYSVRFIIQTITGISIPDAAIRFDGTDYAPGTYLFEGLEAGSYSYLITRSGFISVSGIATLVNADLVITIIMEVEPTKNIFLRLYPIPTNLLLTVESSEAFNEIEVYNAIGQLVMAASFEYRLKHTIDVGTLAAGMYMLRAYTERDVRAGKFEVVHW